MLIVAFDIATLTGACHGVVGDAKPLLWTWNLTDGGDERPSRLAHLDRFLTAYFADFKPAIVAYEKPLGIAVIAGRMAHGIYNINEDTLAMLRGAIGVLEARAAAAGVPKIIQVDIKDARGHLCGQRTFPKGQDAKAATMRACAALGWRPASNDESDAAAIWSLVCAQENPAMANLTRAHLAAKDVTIGRKSERVARQSAGPLFAKR